MRSYNFKDLTGKNFHRLTVISFAEIKKSGTYWNCKCLCGKEKKILAGNLTSGITKSCGCIHKERLKLRNTTHGLSKHPCYRLCFDAKARCEDVNNEHYYGRIKFNFSSVEEMVQYLIDNLPPKPEGYSIDRKDNDGHYEPDNLKWSEQTEQNLNKRILIKKASSYRGVGWNKKDKRWTAMIKLNKKTRFIGNFPLETDAAEAFVGAYYTHHGKWPPEYRPMKLNWKN